MSDVPTPSDSPSAGGDSSGPATRTIRTFKNRALAEDAVRRLGLEGIESTILDLAPPPGRPALNSEAVRLVVDSQDAQKAMKLLVSHHGAGASSVPGGDGSARRRPRPMPSAKTGMPWLFILTALLGAGGAIYYFAFNYFGPKKAAVPYEKPVERYINEDTNHDGKIDVRRYLNASGQLTREEWDRNFDGKWDLRLNYENGKLRRRAVDFDNNGAYDEETVFDNLGRPYYSQVTTDGKGAVTKRYFYQEAAGFDDWDPTPEELGPPDDPSEKNSTAPQGGDSWPYKVLLDNDSDGHFDVEQMLNIKGEVKSERKLEKGAPENMPPKF